MEDSHFKVGDRVIAVKAPRLLEKLIGRTGVIVMWYQHMSPGSPDHYVDFNLKGIEASCYWFHHSDLELDLLGELARL